MGIFLSCFIIFYTWYVVNLKFRFNGLETYYVANLIQTIYLDKNMSWINFDHIYCQKIWQWGGGKTI